MIAWAQVSLSRVFKTMSSTLRLSLLIHSSQCQPKRVLILVTLSPICLCLMVSLTKVKIITTEWWVSPRAHCRCLFQTLMVNTEATVMTLIESRIMIVMVHPWPTWINFSQRMSSNSRRWWLALTIQSMAPLLGRHYKLTLSRILHLCLSFQRRDKTSPVPSLKLESLLQS